MRRWSAVGRLQWRRFRELMSYLRSRGFSHTMHLALSVWRDRNFDGRTGFDTGILDDLQTHRRRLPALNGATIYAPSRAKPLLSLLQLLSIPTDAVFVDLGCGKGRALIVAAQYGVKKLKGIELVPEFIRSCEANLQKIRAAGRGIEWAIFNTDINRYEVSAEDDVFYLYDPCLWEDVVGCLNNILASWRATPRGIRVIYHNNLLPKARIESTVTAFDRIDEYCLDGNWFYVLAKDA
jgi:SAM-dependent methyltransferase